MPIAGDRVLVVQRRSMVPSMAVLMSSIRDTQVGKRPAADAMNAAVGSLLGAPSIFGSWNPVVVTHNAA